MAVKHLMGFGALCYQVNRNLLRTRFTRSNNNYCHQQTGFFLRAMSGSKQQHGASAETDKSSQKKKDMSFVEAYDLKRANLHMTKDSSPMCATVIHSGLSPESLGHYGLPELANLLKIADVCGLYATHMPTDESGQSFFEYDKLTQECFAFVAASQVDILPAMYDPSVSKSPLELKIQNGHIGRTSLSTVHTMTSPADPGPHTLMIQVNQLVLVNKTTRKPCPVPDHVREKYQGHCIRGEPLIIKPQPVPESGPLSVYEVKVAWSDIDLQHHTNFTNYARFALDAVHDALRLGRLEGHMTEANMAAGVRRVKLAYLGESTEGDRLRVKVWRGGEGEGGEHRHLVCSMEKEEGGAVISQATLSFVDC